MSNIRLNYVLLVVLMWEAGVPTKVDRLRIIYMVFSVCFTVPLSALESMKNVQYNAKFLHFQGFSLGSWCVHNGSPLTYVCVCYYVLEEM